MKDDVLRFRKCVEILKNEKGKSNKQIQVEMGVSEPTFSKLINDDISALKVRASILAAVQDFNRKHCNDINYAGIKPDAIEDMKKNLSDYSSDKPEKKFIPEQPKEILKHADFVEAITAFAKSLPSNVKITITVN